jgi:hypothetical protein
LYRLYAIFASLKKIKNDLSSSTGTRQHVALLHAPFRWQGILHPGSFPFDQLLKLHREKHYRRQYQGHQQFIERQRGGLKYLVESRHVDGCHLKAKGQRHREQEVFVGKQSYPEQ